MPYPFKRMDDPFITLGHLPRMGRALPRLFGVYEHTAKIARTRKPFASINISFLLRGRGHYSERGRRWSLTAPCLFHQRAGVCVDYGPSGSWWEFSLVYLPAALPRLNAVAALTSSAVIPLAPEYIPRLHRLIDALRDAAGDIASRRAPADPADALALALLLEVRALSAVSGAQPVREDPLDAIRRRLGNFTQPTPNLDALAREHGLSPAGFRRLWSARYRVSPGNYNLQVRLREACRLLRSESLTHAEIAEQTGFGDPLYFSRRFSSALGESPSAYRQRIARNATLPTVDGIGLRSNAVCNRYVSGQGERHARGGRASTAVIREE